MPQKNIWDFYSICKKKLDRLHNKKLNQSNQLRNATTTQNSTRSPIKRLVNEKVLTVKLDEKLKNDKLLLDNEHIRLSSSPKKGPNGSNGKQLKLSVDAETRQIILKSKTIIDQVKSPVRVYDYAAIKDEFIFKKPLSPAPRSKRKTPDEFKQVRELGDFKVPDSCRVKKRLFDSNPDDLKTKFSSNVELFNKLKDFQKKSSITSRFNVSFYSPSKSVKDQEERRAKSNEIINYSPKKYLENKLKNLSPKSASSIRISSNCIENQPPVQSSLDSFLNRSLNSSFNLPLFSSISPLKPKTPDTNIETKIDLNLPNKYIELVKLFSNLETVISILYNRQESSKFNKIKSCVEKMTKREFDLKHLAQIVTIYPNAYLLEYDKFVNMNDSPDKSVNELVVRPNLLSDRMAPYTIQTRISEFKDRLFQFAKQKHSDYLLTLEEPIILNSLELVRWHPSFQFPDIPEAKLPKSLTIIDSSPIGSPVSKFWSSRLNIESNKKSKDKIDDEQKIDNNDSKIKEGVLKGISHSFLAKVKMITKKLR